MRKKGRRYRVKVTKIVCDHCHKEITGNPIKFFPEWVDRKTGDIMTTGAVPGAEEQHNIRILKQKWDKMSQKKKKRRMWNKSLL